MGYVLTLQSFDRHTGSGDLKPKFCALVSIEIVSHLRDTDLYA